MTRRLISTALLLTLTATLAYAQEPPYFVTYDHHLERPHMGSTPPGASGCMPI